MRNQERIEYTRCRDAINDVVIRIVIREYRRRLFVRSLFLLFFPIFFFFFFESKVLLEHANVINEELSLALQLLFFESAVEWIFACPRDYSPNAGTGTRVHARKDHENSGDEHAHFYRYRSAVRIATRISLAALFSCVFLHRERIAQFTHATSVES